MRNQIMNIEFTYELNDKQMLQAMEVYSKSKANDSFSMSSLSETDPADSYILAYNNDQLLGYLEIFDLCDELEVNAFVLPEHRNNGVFSNMKKLLISSFQGSDIRFITDGSSEAVKALIAQGKYNLIKTEYLLSCDLTDFTTASDISLMEAHFDKKYYKYVKNIFHKELALSEIMDMYSYYDSEINNPYYLYSDRNIIGIFCISYINSASMLSFFGITDEYKGMGLGLKSLNAIKKLAMDNNMNNIIVQVYGENKPALSLYKKAGFKTESYIEYIS